MSSAGILGHAGEIARDEPLGDDLSYLAAEVLMEGRVHAVGVHDRIREPVDVLGRRVAKPFLVVRREAEPEVDTEFDQERVDGVPCRPR